MTKTSADAAMGRPVTLYRPDGHLPVDGELEADIIRLAIGHYRGRMTEVARRLGIGPLDPLSQARRAQDRHRRLSKPLWVPCVPRLPLLLLLAACRSEPSAGAESAAPKSACSQRMFDGSRFTVCDPGNGRIELVAAARGSDR